jgi:HAD superfamily hydrolase (TIGR01509 family)
MVKAIIFDCFGVLTTDVWRAFLDSLPPSADVQRARDLCHAANAGMIGQDEYLQGVEEATGFRPPEIEKTFRGEVVKNTPLLRYIRELKRDYAIGLLSNASSNWIRQEFLTEEEQELFDVTILSYEVGMIKPDPRIFMLACERLRIGPHEAVIVDDVESYVAAAEGEGLMGVVYRDLDDFKQNIALLTGLSVA